MDLKYLKEKLEMLKNCLNEADRRFNIAIEKMNEITKRVHELEVSRNLALRKQFIQSLKNPPKELIKELNNINADDKDILVYEEIMRGYKSMSNRKNVLEEERNIYVKDIEDLEKVILNES